MVDYYNTHDTATNTTYGVRRKAATLLVNDLAYILNKEQETDVHFELFNDKNETDKVISVHSVVLMARSSWFQQYLKSNKDLIKRPSDKFPGYNVIGNYNNEDKYDVKDVLILQRKEDFDVDKDKHTFYVTNVSLSAFKELVRFLYTSNCDVTPLNGIDLLKCARIFNLLPLETKLGDFLWDNLNEHKLNEAIELLRLADKCKAAVLKQKCIDFINSKDTQIIQTRLWTQLTKENPKLVLEIFLSRKNNDSRAPTPSSSQQPFNSSNIPRNVSFSKNEDFTINTINIPANNLPNNSTNYDSNTQRKQSQVVDCNVPFSSSNNNFNNLDGQNNRNNPVLSSNSIILLP